MRTTAVEPNVQNVGDNVIIIQIISIAQKFLMIGVEPSICTACFESFDNAGIDRRVIQIIARFAIQE